MHTARIHALPSASSARHSHVRSLAPALPPFRMTTAQNDRTGVGDLVPSGDFILRRAEGAPRDRTSFSKTTAVEKTVHRATFAARCSVLLSAYCPTGSTLTRPATTIGLPVSTFLKTKPRAIRFDVPAEASPESPLMFSKIVASPVKTVNAPPAE